MKKIIVFVYPFEQAEQIVDFAFRFGRDMRQSIEFVHAVESAGIPWDPMSANNMSMFNGSPDSALVSLINKRTEQLRKVIEIKKASMELPVSVSFSITPGSREYLTEDVSGRNNVDMVLVPNNQEDESQVAVSELIDNISHPVLTFPLDQEYQPIKTIMYATDYDPKDIMILKRIAELSRHIMASLTVFHINKKSEYESELKKAGLQKMIRDKIKFEDIKVLQEKSGKIAEGIKNFTRKNYADVLVLLKKNRNFFQSIFGKSTTRELIKDADIPILIFHQ